MTEVSAHADVLFHGSHLVNYSECITITHFTAAQCGVEMMSTYNAMPT